MKSIFLGLGLFLFVSFLDVSQGGAFLWAYDLPSAQSALKSKNYQKVIELLSPEVEKLNREALFVLAKAYSATQKHEAAIKAYTACLALDPKDYEAKTLIGAEQLVSGKERDALATLKASLEMNPKFVPTYKVLLRYYEKKNNKYEQRLLWEDLINKTAETSEALTRLCELTTQDRLYELAEKYCNKGIQRDPKIATNYVYLGITLHETGHSEKAETTLKQAAVTFPKSVEAQITYAQFLDEKKNFISSYLFYKAATKADPKSVPALLGLGNSSLEIQKYAESLEAYSSACTLDKKTLPAFRKATNTLRTMKISDWLKKFESAIDRCGG